MTEPDSTKEIVTVTRPTGASSVLLVCEHASHHIPAELEELGLSAAARHSHAAWDPGALGVALALSARLDATLVAANVSRLVYDCNRPPEAPGAMPARVEAFDIPGNVALSAAQKEARVARFYEPFRAELAAQVARRPVSVLVTIHSFTPVYNGVSRDVEIGILHDSDARLADALLEASAQHDAHLIERNAPYGPGDGVTHTLKAHALPFGHLNVMIELRNDLIQTKEEQGAMADLLALWLSVALAKTGGAACSA